MAFKFSPLLSEEMAKQGYTHRLDFSYRDITAGVANNTAETFNIAGLPAGTTVYDCFLILVTPFEDLSDAAFNTTTVSLGDSDSATSIVSAVQVNRNGTEVYNQFNASVDNLYATANTLIFTVNSQSGKSISNLDAGQLLILLRIGNENRAAIIDAQAP